jgi:hypothetical protein
LGQLRIELQVWSAVNSGLIVEATNLTPDKIEERNLTLGIANVLVGIKHGLQPDQEAIFEQGRRNRSVIVAQAETNNGLNDSKQIVDTMM